MVLGSFIFSDEKIPHVQKAQKATFFILDVFMRIKAQKAQDIKQAASSS